MKNLVCLKDISLGIFDCPHSTPKWTSEGIIVIRNQNIRNGRLDLTEKSYTDYHHYTSRIKRASPDYGDIIITREAPMGEVCQIPKDLKCCLGQRMVLVKPNNALINSKYLLYALQSPPVQHEIHIHDGTGSTVSNFRIPYIEELKIPLPPLPTQKAIAHILGTLDDKIELNRRMNETLESIARATFTSWFINFDPVRAKAETRQPEGMDAATAALFPSEFETVEGQEIPKGWRIGCINDLCSMIENGGTPQRMEPSFWEYGTIPWYKTGELNDEPLFDSSEKITNLGLEKSACRLWDKGTILFALYASPTLGRMGILETKATANQACSALFAKKEYGFLFLYYSLFYAREHLQNIAVGAAQQNINQKVLRDHEILLPPEELAQKFHSHLQNQYFKKISNLKENLLLTNIRDTLLPKLLSGELPITNPEQFTGVS